MLLRVVVTAQGLPTQITVLSPLGHGLDEQAIAAIEKWKFSPPMKNGQPVAVRYTIAVNFSYPWETFDQTFEKHRTRLNAAIQTLRDTPTTSPAFARAFEDIQSLSEQEFAPAMYAMGLWETTGSAVPKNLHHGLTLIQKAAAKEYAPALYNLATREIEGHDLPADPKRGIDHMQQAAGGGSIDAQFYLGDSYQKGKGVAVDPNRARRYFRLCAAQGKAVCQFRLASMLMDPPDASERDHVQAIAWFELAGESMPEAPEIAAREIATLTADQSRAVSSLKARLVQK